MSENEIVKTAKCFAEIRKSLIAERKEKEYWDEWRNQS